MSFFPRIFSSPKEPCVNFSSHVTEPSLTSIHIEDSSPRQRHQAGRRIKNRIHDTSSFESIYQIQNSVLNKVAGIPDGWKEKEGWNLRYIDDGLAGEVICNTNAISHIMQAKEVKYLYAKKSEDYLKNTAKNAEKIGM